MEITNPFVGWNGASTDIQASEELIVDDLFPREPENAEPAHVNPRPMKLDNSGFVKDCVDYNTDTLINPSDDE
ncbi:unnamed protein product [Bursaphelenchus okinawaensis]|uniref:Uncharacterized protein n=1 Tax=Bursaphelenchus okinawaensis TaxID=465554 RepID=A0A811LKK6_9BILA|nr:unnamed protein product [Bursaphelenchus okinawaensis]CAG9124209.1 unnamed protein product [Bursaphelenchus okinawaensis]